MSAPILRVGKIKSSGAHTAGSVDAHLSRARPTPNADPAKTALNRVLIGGTDQPLGDAIAAVMAKAGIDRAKLRKDAVLANDIMLSVSPEWIRPDDPERHGHYDPARLSIFEAEAVAFLKQTFGARVAKAVLHIDEATPHIHAVVVPIMPRVKDGQKIGYRLSGKDLFNPRGLVALQQGWEDRLVAHGVGRRVKGSKATHKSLKAYYSAIEAFDESAPKPAEIGSPPVKNLLEGAEAYQKRVDEWRKSEATRLRAERRPLEIAAAKGRLFEAERRGTVELRAIVSDVAHEAGRLREALADADRDLELSKAEISALRATPINSVADVLGYTGSIGAKENAIDLVKRVGGLDYRDAVAWLAQRFGPETAATAIREHALPQAEAAAAGPAVLTKGERFKVRVVTQQLDALAAPAYRVTLMRSVDGERVGRNLGKAKDGAEQFFTKSDIINMIPRLTAENARGCNVFITPQDAAAWHVLVDDLTPDALHELKQRGYAPATVLETSPANAQAVLKLPKSAAPKEPANAWFKDLNRALGDAKITGLVHPFRLAGFANCKERHRQPDGRYPFVKLLEATNRLCAKSMAVVRDYAQKAELLVTRRSRPAGPRRR